MSGAAPQKGGLVLAGEPSVQLLPQSVRERGKVREFRRLMILLMVLAVVIVAGGVAWALGRQLVAQASLLAAQQQTQALLAQQAEYADAVIVADLVDATRQAQQLLTTSDVDWGALYGEITDRLMSDAGVDGGVFITTEPWQGLPEEELAADAGLSYYAPISVTLASDRIITAAEIAFAMRGMTGYVGSWISGTIEEDGTYFTTIGFAFNDEILAHRFAGDDEVQAPESDTSDEASVEPEATPSGTPTPTPTSTQGATP